MRTLIFVITTLLSTLSTSALACEPESPTTLPTFKQVELAIASFQAEVYGHEGIEGFERNLNMFDTLRSQPIVDRWGALELMTARPNPYILMGYPARITTRNNSYFFGQEAVEHYQKKGVEVEKHFNIGPGVMMGKIVLAHEIGHTFGLNEVDADIFAAAYAQHDVWDLAQYYLRKENPSKYWANESGNGDYLPLRSRIILLASVF